MGILNAVESVFKADPEAGSALVDMIVLDYLADQSEAVRKDFDALVGPWALDRVLTAKRHLARGYVSKAASGEYPDAEVQQVAKWLVGLEGYLKAAVTGEISKAAQVAEDWTVDGSRQRRFVARDQRGRFTRSISQNASRNPAGLPKSSIHPQVEAYTNEKGVIDQASTELGGDEESRKQTYDAALRMQGQWTEAQQALAELKSGLPKGVRDEADAVLVVRRADQTLRYVNIPLKSVSDKNPIPIQSTQIPEIGETLSHIEIQPSVDASRNTRNQLAALDTLSTIGGEAGARAAMIDRERWNNLAGSLAVSNDPKQSKLTRFFNQVAAGGDVLQGIPGADKYGRFATFVGSAGPEAEKVLGPYVQRAAYRYRGTETSPDKNLVRAFNGAEMKQVDAIASGAPVPESAVAAAAALRTGDKRGRGLASAMMTDAAFRSAEGLSQDSLSMQVRADMAGAELAQTLPKDPIIARLSEAAGSILPSQGILINADGKVVSQAVGNADDHYLPFDLRNLSTLRGGQYVRTRQSGGLTGEDIYAAVTMGARMVTVVSPSGVYTLEMAPDFRGARSMSDKARGMYDRYLKVLDAVDGSGQYLQDIPAAERQKIEADVKSLRLDKTRTDELIDERVTEAREKSQRLSSERIDQIESDLLADKYRGVPKESLRGADARRFSDDLEEAIQVEQSRLTNKLRLNGEGYAVALATLQQQYPYFIKGVRYEPLNDFAAMAGIQGVKGRTMSRDTGYVAPGGLKARSTREGFYKPDTGRKFKSEPTEASTGGATAAPAAVAAATGAAAPEQAAAIPAPDTGVNARLKTKAPVLKMVRDKAAGELIDAFGTLPPEIKISGQMGNSMDSIDDLSGSNDQIVSWVISQQKSILDRDLNDPEKSLKVIAALADEDAVRQVLASRLNVVGGGGFLTDGGKFGGQDNEKDAVDWTVRQARLVSDATLMVQPFSGGPQMASGQWRAPMVDSRIAGIKDKDQLDAYAADNPETWAAAVDLATSGSRYDSLTGVAQVAGKRLKQLDQIKVVQGQIAEAGGDINVSDLAMSTEDIGNALGIPADQVTIAAIQEVEPDDQKRALGAAWQLATTGRVLEMLDGGDVFPKDESQRWLLAKASQHKTRVRVLSPSDPLSKAVAARVAKGMTFVPSRRR